MLQHGEKGTPIISQSASADFPNKKPRHTYFCGQKLFATIRIICGQ